MKVLLKRGMLMLLVFFIVFTGSVFAESVLKVKISNPFPSSEDGNSFDFGVVEPGDVLEGSFDIRVIADGVFDVFLEFVPVGSDAGTKIPLEDWLEQKGNKYSFTEKGQSEHVDFNINIPEDILPGEYVANMQATQKGNSAAGISINLAASRKVIFSIAGERNLELALTDVSFERSNLNKGVLGVVVKYKNMGNVTLVPTLAIDLKNDDGEVLFEDEVNVRNCERGAFCSHTFLIENLDLKMYETLSADVDLFFSRGKGGEKQLSGEASISLVYVSVFLYAGALGLLFLVLMIIYIIARRRKKSFNNLN